MICRSLLVAALSAMLPSTPAWSQEKKKAPPARPTPPVKACLHDAARALQTIRSKAKEWNLDPKRVGATGGSAGACTSLWLAFHDDLADPKSDDPVARQSSRLTCAAVLGAQVSYDPRWIKEKIGGR